MEFLSGFYLQDLRVLGFRVYGFSLSGCGVVGCWDLGLELPPGVQVPNNNLGVSEN